MAALFKPSARLNGAILKGFAVLMILGCMAALAAVAIVDWSLLHLHDELVASNRIGAAESLSAEARTIVLLNIGVVVAVVLNLIAVRRVLRSYAP